MTEPLDLRTSLDQTIADSRANPRGLTAIDLFCGIGGFHIAAAYNGIPVTFASEIDSAAAHCYYVNFKQIPHGDIAQCQDAIPPHDILMAGFPCQPFSIMGKGNGLEDAAKGRIVFEALKIAQRLKPSAIVLENVKRFATHAQGETLRSVTDPLEPYYNVTYAILNALDFGLPQKRERAFIVALKKGAKPMTWPAPQGNPPSLETILEKDVDARYYASPKIRADRRRDHQTEQKPAIWHENRVGKVNSHPYSCSLRADSSHNYLLVDGERRLTERELLRLQGFPELYNPAGKYGQTKKQIGNAVPVPVAAAVLSHVLEALEYRPITPEKPKSPLK